MKFSRSINCIEFVPWVGPLGAGIVRRVPCELPGAHGPQILAFKIEDNIPKERFSN
jgi:hypothetical protein